MRYTSQIVVAPIFALYICSSNLSELIPLVAAVQKSNTQGYTALPSKIERKLCVVDGGLWMTTDRQCVFYFANMR